MKFTCFAILVLLVQTAKSQSAEDTFQVINYVVNTELYNGKMERNDTGPTCILLNRTIAWNIGGIDRYLIHVKRPDNTTIDTTDLYARLMSLPSIYIDSIITSRYKLILSSLFPDDPAFTRQLTMFAWVSFTTPLFLTPETCIISIKGPDWQLGILLYKEKSKWTKLAYVGGGGT